MLLSNPDHCQFALVDQQYKNHILFLFLLVMGPEVMDPEILDRANAGEEAHQLIVGKHYMVLAESGVKPEENGIKATEWLILASKQGNETATELLCHCMDTKLGMLTIFFSYVLNRQYHCHFMFFLMHTNLPLHTHIEFHQKK